MIAPRCDCPPGDAPPPHHDGHSVWREVAVAAIGGAVAAIVSEVGQGVREWLRDRREAANPQHDTKHNEKDQGE